MNPFALIPDPRDFVPIFWESPDTIVPIVMEWIYYGAAMFESAVDWLADLVARYAVRIVGDV